MKFLHRYLIIVFFVLLIPYKEALGLDASSFDDPFVLETSVLENYSFFLENAESTTDSALCSIRPNSTTQTYIEYNSNFMFRYSESTLQLIENTENYSSVRWSAPMENLYMCNLIISGDYLIVSGEEYTYDGSFTSLMFYDISDLNNISLSKTLSFSGLFTDISSNENSVILIADNTCTITPDYAVPYYIENGLKTAVIPEDTLMKKNSSIHSLLSVIEISLENLTVDSFKCLYGFGNNVYFDNHSIFVTSNYENSTSICKFNLLNDIFEDVSHITIYGNITNYNSINIFNNNLRIITSLKNGDNDTFAIHYIDENFSTIWNYYPEEAAFVEDSYFMDDMLFLKYNNRVDTDASKWMSIQFKENRFNFTDINGFDYVDTIVSPNYIFVLNNESQDQISLKVLDKSYNKVDSLSVSTNNSIFLSSHVMALDKSTPILAVPIYYNPDNISHGILVFRKTPEDKIYLDMILSNIYSEKSNFSDSVPEYMSIKDDTVYTFFKDKVMLYDLENNLFIKELKL